ncbi:MAG: NADH-quinone oxidoreductase subunit H [Candidatus Omnitrophica bacterium]|nr:NADH-quinone oxidoreductase subunit H [Candidatus Omnitrophota bacterium]MDD5352509.1 NADH-quinone oxidoreductase subunit H [Candidatus Omnitrophota bacterium]MDD5550107.1 NADH-quinone oxidoreductase subunit H [Candidatus Omnitrophota bacterium]
MTMIFYFIFFGFFVSVTAGLLISWIDRKVTARLQYRVGPPILQPFTDIVKLLGKELLLPKGASKITFLFSPILGIISIMIVTTLLWLVNIWPQKTFFGDLIVVLYFLVLPSLGIILGGFASRNPLASIGASREMKLVMAYELPFILAVFVPVAKSGLSIKLGEIISYQSAYGAFISNWSGVLSFIVILFCVQAKLGLVPFDMAEAETELAGGALIEYSGPSLAIFKLTKAMMLFVLPYFIVILFLGGFNFNGLAAVRSLLGFVAIIVLIIVIRNTNPRLRVDQALRFFWGPMTILAILALVLAGRGL